MVLMVSFSSRISPLTFTVIFFDKSPLAMAVATALLGQIASPWQLYAVNALLAFGWAGTSLGMITNTLGLWFDKKRGMAISLALTGASCRGLRGAPLGVRARGSFVFAVAGAGATVAPLPGSRSAHGLAEKVASSDNELTSEDRDGMGQILPDGADGSRYPAEMMPDA